MAVLPGWDLDGIMTVKQHDKEPSKQMNIDEAKTLLNTKGITFEEKDYATQREYWEHCSEFWHFEYASTKPDSMRKVLVIPCANGKKDIEIEFEQKDGEFEFVDLLFGSFAFEVEEDLPEGSTIEESLMEYLSDLLQNRYTVLTVSSIEGGVIMDSFRPNVSAAGREKLVDSYKKAVSFWGRLLKKHYVAEIYDCNLYQRIEFNDYRLSQKSKAAKLWWTFKDPDDEQ